MDPRRTVGEDDSERFDNKRWRSDAFGSEVACRERAYPRGLRDTLLLARVFPVACCRENITTCEENDAVSRIPVFF